MYKQLLCFLLCALLLLAGCAEAHTPTNQEASSTTSTTPNSTTTSTITITTTTAVNHTSETSTNKTTSTTTSSKPPYPETTDFTSTTATTVTTSTSSTQTTSTTGSNTIVFTATIRDESKQLISNVMVTIYTENESQSAVTDHKGVARLQLHPSSSYKVVLTNLPADYEAKSEYNFNSTTVNITLRKKAVQNEADHSKARYDVGNTMTDFTLTDTDGNDYRLSELLKEKKLIILDFWFTSCEPCKQEFPYFEAAVQKYADDVILLAVNPFDTNATIRQFREQMNRYVDTKISFPLLRDTCNLYMGFEVTNYPTTVFVDSNGYILDIHTGMFPSVQALIAKIETYID